MSAHKDSKPESGEGEPQNDAAAPTESSPPAADATPPAAPAGLPVAEQLVKLQAEKEELWQTLVRRQADFENYRKRIERERHEDGQRATARLIEGLLPVLDAFERALAAHNDLAYKDYRKGFELIYRQLWDALARLGLERIEAAGKRFDPHYHMAIERVESLEQAEGTVIEVMQQGYLLRGKVLRPASVRVAAHPSGNPAETPEQVN